MLYKCKTPILGIFGTSAVQGKFTLQLKLRGKFLMDHYRLGQLGTEPPAELFNMDASYPFGFNSDKFFHDDKVIFQINNLIHSIEEKNPNLDMIMGYNEEQNSFLCGDFFDFKYYTVEQ